MTNFQRQPYENSQPGHPTRPEGSQSSISSGSNGLGSGAPISAPPKAATGIAPAPAGDVQVSHMTIPADQRGKEIYRVAAERFRQNPDWVTFFREIMGVDGLIRRSLTNPEELASFEQQNEYQEIQQMVAKLRERSKHQTESNEPTRVITVRLPKSLHESLRAEAHQKRTSMNQLCISKLLQLINNDLVPSD